MKAMVRRVQHSRRKTDKYGATVKVLVSLCGFCRLLPKLNKHNPHSKVHSHSKVNEKDQLKSQREEPANPNAEAEC